MKLIAPQILRIRLIRWATKKDREVRNCNKVTEIGKGKEAADLGDLRQAIQDYEARDKARTDIWLHHFGNDVERQT